MFEAEAEAIASRPRPNLSDLRGQNFGLEAKFTQFRLEDLTSLCISSKVCSCKLKYLLPVHVFMQ